MPAHGGFELQASPRPAAAPRPLPTPAADHTDAMVATKTLAVLLLACVAGAAAKPVRQQAMEPEYDSVVDFLTSSTDFNFTSLVDAAVVSVDAGAWRPWEATGWESDSWHPLRRARAPARPPARQHPAHASCLHPPPCPSRRAGRRLC